MINTIKQQSEWITLNIVNGIYLIKDWILINIGVGLTTDSSMFDDILKGGIGVTIMVFNIVRIIKYIIEIKERKNKK